MYLFFLLEDFDVGRILWLLKYVFEGKISIGVL